MKITSMFKLFFLVMLLTYSTSITLMSKAQSLPTDFYASMKVNSKSKLNIDKTFFVTCDSVVRKFEMPEQIGIIETTLNKYNFKVIPNKQVDSILNLPSEEYYRAGSFSNAVKKEVSNAEINSKTKITSFYVVSYAMSQIKDVGIDHYLLKIIIYEQDTKKILASGEVENSHGRLRNKFSKYVNDFFEQLMDE